LDLGFRLIFEEASRGVISGDHC